MKHGIKIIEKETGDVVKFIPCQKRSKELRAVAELDAR